MNICRQTDVDLIFQNDQGAKIRDLCSWVVGLSGKIDDDSGMIINLIDIDHGLKLFKKKFSSTEIDNLPDFFRLAQKFLENTFAPFPAELNLLQLKTSWGQLRWGFPWKSEDLVLTQSHRIKAQSKSKHFEVYKVFTEYRGPSIRLFKRIEHDQLKKLWQLQNSSEELTREMRKLNHLSAFGVQDFSGQHQRWFRLGL